MLSNILVPIAIDCCSSITLTLVGDDLSDRPMNHLLAMLYIQRAVTGTCSSLGSRQALSCTVSTSEISYAVHVLSIIRLK